VLEKAVTWVIIIIVIVFDPLAVILLLASQYSFQWFRQAKEEEEIDYMEQHFQEVADELNTVFAEEKPKEPMRFVDPGEHPKDHLETELVEPEPIVEKTLAEQHPYVTKGFAHFENLKRIVAPVPELSAEEQDDDDADDPASVKEAIKKWKTLNPDDTIKNQRHMLARGEIEELTTLVYDARENALHRLMEHAVEAGADDVVGIKTYVYSLGGGVIEFLAIGTAVKKVPGLKTASDNLPPQAVMSDKDTFINLADQRMGANLNEGKKQ
jgi:hypothetical protein